MARRARGSQKSVGKFYRQARKIHRKNLLGTTPEAGRGGYRL